MLNSLGNPSRFFKTASNDLTETAAVTEATICNLEQFGCFSRAKRRTDNLMFDLKQRGLTIVDSSNMPEAEKAVKSYVSLVSKNLRSRFDFQMSLRTEK